MINLLTWLIVLIIILLTPVVVVLALLGLYVLYVGSRFKKSAGAKVDGTAFYTNWLVFIWAWAEQSDYIVAAMPHFKKDLTETFNIRPDDGETT